MLKMGGGLAITGADGPAVGVKIDETLSLGDHRLDGDAHACLEQDAVAPAAVVGYLRVFMHLVTDAVAGELTDDAVMLSLAMRLDGMADVTEMVACHCVLNAFVEGFPGGPEELLHIVGHLTHAERVTGVAAEAIETGAAVYGDDVALLEDGIAAGDPVHHDVID